MKTVLFRVTLLSLICLAFPGVVSAEEKAEELVRDGFTALKEREPKKALDLARKALAIEPKNVQGHFLLGRAHEELHQHKEAIVAFTKTIALDPKHAEAYNQRGSEHFKLGQIAESLEDFNRFLKLRPEATPSHWKRGITLYYLGRYDEGRKQFEGYQTFDANDVENAVWHFLCSARKVGVKKAQESMLNIKKDGRVPMMEVYALYGGKAKPEDVMKAVEEGKPSPDQRNARLFYAHLYLGLYYDALGDKKKALEHLNPATDKHKIGHYMWDVARVHRDLLRK